MFFNGGMIPTYLIIQKLGMLNKIWALVLPSAISTYNMIIMRTFFENTIPNELIEAAALDGCNDITTFFRIVLPLSGAVFAVMALFYGVAQWNSWFPALLYIRDRSLYPLQMILREVLIQSDIGNMAGSTGDVEVIGDGLKYATMVVSTLPIMCLYPFCRSTLLPVLPLAQSRLMGGYHAMRSHDLSLPAWPYTKRYSGISHVPAANDGVRFDLSVFPGMYRAGRCAQCTV